VAARTGVPIVPVGIAGTEKAMPKGSKFLHPARVAIVIGEALPPPDSRSRRAVHEQTDRLLERLQAVFDDAKRLIAT
jgi:1-acyl-sn-glycerol-3-phosphate acyltransferase